MSDPLPIQCPRCGKDKVDVQIKAGPRGYHCASCGHTWEEPYLRQSPDRRKSPAST